MRYAWPSLATPVCLSGVRPLGHHDTYRLTMELGLAGVRLMARHRIHSLSFKKQIVQEYAAGATLNGLAREHDLSRNLIRGGRPNQLWVADITCDAIATGFVYLAAIGDLGGECRV